MWILKLVFSQLRLHVRLPERFYPLPLTLWLACGRRTLSLVSMHWTVALRISFLIDYDNLHTSYCSREVTSNISGSEASMKKESRFAGSCRRYQWWIETSNSFLPAPEQTLNESYYRNRIHDTKLGSSWLAELCVGKGSTCSPSTKALRQKELYAQYFIQKIPAIPLQRIYLRFRIQREKTTWAIKICHERSNSQFQE